MRFHSALIPLLLFMLLISGCSKKPIGGPRLKTTPVKGVLTVDGKPEASITVTCYPESDSSAAIKFPVVSTTDSNGRFVFGTYESGDGLPKGKYKLTFAWKTPSMALRENKTDKLNNAYSDPKASKFDFTVVEGEAKDLGPFELSTNLKAD